MNELNATLVMVALFALRCIVPLIITVGLGYLMNRLVDYWETEDERVTAPVPSPATSGTTTQPKPLLGDLSLPCWLTNSCAEKKRANCAAYRNQNLPCWEARRQAEGILPAPCPGCPRYQAAHAIA